jgi:hypothetical protein
MMGGRLHLRVCALSLVAVAVSMGGAGCRRPHVKGTVAVETILKAWQDEGFDAKTVENVDAEPWSAGACSHGTITGLDVLLCEYETDEGLAGGETKIMSEWQAESVGTGATVRSSRTLLAIADRNAVDPSGRNIARLIKSFRNQH